MMSRIFWISGSPCAGKTAVSQILANRFNWQLYRCDDFFGEHRDRASPEAHPTFYTVSRLRGDDLWLRPAETQIRTEIEFAADEFKLVMADVRERLAGDERPLLFDGVAALPHLLHPLLPHSHHAIWLIPTEAFQRHHYAQRPWIHDVLAETSRPEQAFSNWMARDAAFARWLEKQAAAHELAWLSVDGSLTIAETADYVARHFESVP